MTGQALTFSPQNNSLLKTTAPPYAADQPSDQEVFQAAPFTDRLRPAPPAPGPLIEIR
jgi:hypothetical protein